MSAGVAVVIPIRSLMAGKTRLASALPAVARAALVGRMLTGVIRAALDSGVVAAVAVVSPDPAALALAAEQGVQPLRQDPAAPGLNPALEQARAWAMARGQEAVLSLFGDLPLLTAADVHHLVRRDAPVVIAPDHHGVGTNAVLLRLGAAASAARFRFAFGPGSYARHVAEAHALGLETAISLTGGTAFDLDTPDDLRTLLASAEWAAAIAHGTSGFDEGAVTR